MNVDRALSHLAAIALAIAGIAVCALALVQAWQVGARYLLNASPEWTEPVALLLLSTAMSFGAAAAVHARAHFGFVLLAAAAPARWQRKLDIFVNVVVAWIGFSLARWSAVLLHSGLDVQMAGVGLPQSLNFAPLCVGGALMVVFALHQIWRGRPATTDSGVA